MISAPTYFSDDRVEMNDRLPLLGLFQQVLNETIVPTQNPKRLVPVNAFRRLVHLVQAPHADAFHSCGVKALYVHDRDRPGRARFFVVWQRIEKVTKRTVAAPA